MYYSESNNCFIRDDGFQFQPAKKEHYENFGFFLSEENGEIYFIDNNSDKAIDRIIWLHRSHSVDFGFSANPNPYSDSYLKNLLPKEVQDELISHSPSKYQDKFCWKMWDFGRKDKLKKTWEFVQENGNELRHFKTSRCVKKSEIC